VSGNLENCIKDDIQIFKLVEDAVSKLEQKTASSTKDALKDLAEIAKEVP